MSELRYDPIEGRWVIVNTDAPLLPSDIEKEQHQWKTGDCPFCYGNEAMTPPEIDVIRPADTKPNTPGWRVRVVSNKFPALRIEGDVDRRGVGIYDMMNGIGAHEVIIETPYHHKEIPDFTDQEVADILKTCLRRCQDLKRDKRFKYILLFKNYGPSAGASLGHPHIQLIALPMVPKNVQEELAGSKRYFELRERCIFCDIYTQEQEARIRVIQETEHFVAFCPFVSRFSFEMWILPRQHQSCFIKLEQNPDQILDLARVLRESLLRLRNLLFDPAFNFIIHTSPLDKEEEESYHWHIEIMPRLTRVAGFEWGTGFYVVSTPPELAAHLLNTEGLENNNTKDR